MSSSNEDDKAWESASSVPKDKDKEHKVYPQHNKKTITATASPGLMTLLDVALYRSNEGQLTRTVCSANATLHCFLELKSQSTRLLELCLVDDAVHFASVVGKAVAPNNNTTNQNNHHGNSNSDTTAISQTGSVRHNSSSSPLCPQYQRQYQRYSTNASRLASIESFARACQFCARDAIHRLTTDKNSTAANLPAGAALDRHNKDQHHSLPVPPLSHDSPSAPHHHHHHPDHHYSTSGSGSNSHHATSKSSAVERQLLHGILSPSSSTLESHTRSPATIRQTLLRTDQWESPLLHCPDYVWADDAHSHCHRAVKHLSKHSFLVALGGVLSTACHDHVGMMDGVVAGMMMEEGDGEASGGGSGASGGGGGAGGVLGRRTQRVLDNLVTLLRYDLPMRLQQFKCALESDGAASKRLYLIKMEYRAPFRAFLESHGRVQRNPKLELVERYINMQQQDDTTHHHHRGSSPAKDQESHSSWDKCRKDAEHRKQECVEDKGLIEALKLEQECEGLEMEMARALLPFCELARVLDGKGARFVEVPPLVVAEDVPALQEVLRRFKSSLCRKHGPDACPGIRPILLDFQGIPRDPNPKVFEISPFDDDTLHKSTKTNNKKNNTITNDDNDQTEQEIQNRIKICCSHLQTIYKIAKTKGGFYMDKNESPVLSATIRECANLDPETFTTNYLEWYRKCLRQRAISAGEEVSSLPSTSNGHQHDNDDDQNTNDNDDDNNDKIQKTRRSFKDLTKEIRLAEMEVSIAKASKQALTVVQKRLDLIENDRTKKFDVLQEMAGEVCLREMDFVLRLVPPQRDAVLRLPHVKSAIGILSPTLLLAGEPLPVG